MIKRLRKTIMVMNIDRRLKMVGKSVWIAGVVDWGVGGLSSTVGIVRVIARGKRAVRPFKKGPHHMPEAR